MKSSISANPNIDELGSLVSAAVLVIIHYSYGKSPHILLTKRSSQLKSHTGEISFPGGRHSKGDESLLHTALRETKEEIGIEFKTAEILGSLQTVRTLSSNFAIVPFVTVQEKIPPLKIEVSEVERVLDIPLDKTLATMEIDKQYARSSQEAYRFVYQGDIIWGATAGIMKQIHDLLIKSNSSDL